ncbi:MAG: hypothetical protein Q4P06_00845 [Actinomycetaceae bacterium]|nr:hypothetical protein [Actinomycetaceae bacterium]
MFVVPVVGLLVALLAGCGSDGATPSPTVTVTVTATPSPTVTKDATPEIASTCEAFISESGRTPLVEKIDSVTSQINEVGKGEWSLELTEDAAEVVGELNRIFDNVNGKNFSLALHVSDMRHDIDDLRRAHVRGDYPEYPQRRLFNSLRDIERVCADLGY